MNEYLTALAPIPDQSSTDAFLTIGQQEELIRRLYEGQTLFQICHECNIERQAIDLEQRFNPEFAKALEYAVEASGDAQAEQALAMLMSVPADDSIPLAERRHMLDKAKITAAHMRWMSEKTGKMFERRQPVKKESRSKTRFMLGVPPKE